VACAQDLQATCRMQCAGMGWGLEQEQEQEQAVVRN
jgi:hypothetical protein